MSERTDATTLEVIRSQRACRAFLDEPIPDSTLAAMIEAASHAPSAENRQPWVFVIVDDPVIRSAVDELTRALWTAGARSHSERNLAQRFFIDVDQFIETGYGGAPRLIVVAGDGRSGSHLEVLAASVFPAVQNLLLAAAALGYGSSMTTLAAQAPDELTKILGLPDGIRPFAVVPVGRRAHAAGTPRRRPVDEIVHRNRYGTPFVQ